jgi:hypothetical protein
MRPRNADFRFGPAEIGVAVLTAIALVLRARGYHEGLYRDELLTYFDTHGRSLGQVLDTVANGAPGAARENNPPLYFVLAWIGSQLGDGAATIRLPSIVLGTATVPLVYLLGRRTVGVAAGVFGAAFIALSPLAVFYGVEARSYGSLMFFSALSALVLLEAAERRRALWWAAYGASVAAVLYTHYVGVLVIATEAAWAIWVVREWRALILTYLGAGALFLPWLPYVHSEVAGLEGLAAIVGVHDWQAFLQWVAGWPEALPSELPGTFALVLLGVAAGIGLVGALLRRAAPWRSPPATLVVLLALTTPIILLLYSLVGDNLFVYPRNLSAAVPFFGLALGWLVTRPPKPFAVAAAALALAAVTLGAAKTVQDRFHRPDTPAVAELLDARLAGQQPVVYYGPGLDPLTIGDLMRIYLHEHHPVRGANLEPGSLDRALAPGGGGHPVLLVQFGRGQPPPVAAGWEQLEGRRFAGNPPLVVSTYARLAAARHRGLSAAPGAISGGVDSAAQTRAALFVGGWALTRDGRPADHVLAYVGDRLVAAGVPSHDRPEVGKLRGAPGDDLGFLLALPTSLDSGERRRIRVFATSGGSTTRLGRFCQPSVRFLLGCPG